VGELFFNPSREWGIIRGRGINGGELMEGGVLRVYTVLENSQN
jgi:hypothetical protein